MGIRVQMVLRVGRIAINHNQIKGSSGTDMSKSKSKNEDRDKEKDKGKDDEEDRRSLRRRSVEEAAATVETIQQQDQINLSKYCPGDR
jgi:hypothetical protein